MQKPKRRYIICLAGAATCAKTPTNQVLIDPDLAEEEVCISFCFEPLAVTCCPLPRFSSCFGRTTSIKFRSPVYFQPWWSRNVCVSTPGLHDGMIYTGILGSRLGYSLHKIELLLPEDMKGRMTQTTYYKLQQGNYLFKSAQLTDLHMTGSPCSCNSLLRNQADQEGQQQSSSVSYSRLWEPYVHRRFHAPQKSVLCSQLQSSKLIQAVYGSCF